MITIHIDGKEITGQVGQTILELAQSAGIYIPNLCHSELLDVYASCGICAVEVESAPRLLRACSTKASDGMVVRTNTARVLANQQATLDLLLSDHKGDCMAPCKLACPAKTECQEYVALVAQGDIDGAMETIMSKIPLPASIGRVCPRPCEEACRREIVDEPITIGSIKEFVGDNAKFSPKVESETGKKIAIVGGGPGGLSAAYFLRIKGHSVTIYDSMPQMGGMLRYGIPEYRLPRHVLDREIAVIGSMGVNFKNNINIGNDIQFASLNIDYDAVIVAAGAWKAAPLNCPGDDANGVLGGIDFLRDVSLGNAPDFKGQKIAIIGGGNTAMDACRTAVRLGADAVYNIYRRTREEMPAEDIEVTEAIEEGVIFKYLVNPLEVTAEDGKVNGMNLQIMQLGEPDEQGRRRPIPASDVSEFLQVDKVIVAIGQWSDLKGLEALCPNRRGNVSVNDDFSTNIPGVFAIGDAVDKGAGIAIEAIADAKTAAISVHAFLTGTKADYPGTFRVEDNTISAETFADIPKANRLKILHRPGDVRRNDFDAVNLPMELEKVIAEAKRCLKCGCSAVKTCKLLKYSNDYEATNKYETQKCTTTLTPIAGDILHNPEKCILCGLCVRTCEEVVGKAALGIFKRGHNAVISLATLPLPKELNCKDCKKCVESCPTGALICSK